MQKLVLVLVLVVSTVPPKVAWSFELYLYLELTVPQWTIVALLDDMFQQLQ